MGGILEIVKECFEVVKYLGVALYCHLIKLDPGILVALPCVGEPCATNVYISCAHFKLP